ncbi:MAG: metallophosphoesterase [Candidatus Omnitrophica bacterium]|nr:metallophosphoesterase [Candidatus Omnitrophota bacterium]
MDKGDLGKEGKDVPRDRLENSTQELLSHFFVGISLPNNSFWVNLRPDSPDDIIDTFLAQTDLGRILLEADLQLKKDTANFTSPNTPEGKDYWNKLYKKAGELFGSERLTIPTLTRPWIVPEEIIIRESSNNAYIYKATLKVMLEEDYLQGSSAYNFTDERLKQLNAYSSQLIRETIIPRLTKEVNTAKRYASLRQVYYSLILAQWFKEKFRGKAGLYSQLIDKKNLVNLASGEPWSKTSYFKAYQDSFNKGEYSFKESVYTAQGRIIRSYLSGGVAFGNEITRAIASSAITTAKPFIPRADYLLDVSLSEDDSVKQPFKLKINDVSIPSSFASSPLTLDKIKQVYFQELDGSRIEMEMGNKAKVDCKLSVESDKYEEDAFTINVSNWPESVNYPDKIGGKYTFKHFSDGRVEFISASSYPRGQGVLAKIVELWNKKMEGLYKELEIEIRRDEEEDIAEAAVVKAFLNAGLRVNLVEKQNNIHGGVTYYVYLTKGNTASSLVNSRLRRAVQKIGRKKIIMNGALYEINVETNNSLWDTRIVLRDARNGKEIGYFELNTKEDAINNARYIQITDKDYLRKGLARLILRRLREVFPVDKELVTEIAQDDSLEAFKNNQEASKVPIVKMFESSGWELVACGYYDRDGIYHRRDFGEQMRDDERSDELGAVIARFKPRIYQLSFPGFSAGFSVSSSSPVRADIQSRVYEAKLFNAREYGLVRKSGVSVDLPQAFSKRHTVIGDIHGDLEGLKQDLRDAGVIDKNGNYIDGNLVVEGDFIDRGPESLEVYEFISALQQEAKVRGNDVVILLGNHEEMFYRGMQGDNKALGVWLLNAGEPAAYLKKWSDERGIEMLAGQIKNSKSVFFSRWGRLYNKLKEDIASTDVKAAYEYRGVLFVHGGVKDGGSAKEVADNLNKELLKGDFSNIHAAVWNTFGEGAGLINGEGLDFLQVVGHVPGSEVRVSKNLRVVNVDVGHWKGYGGRRGYVEIAGNRLRAYALVKEPAASPVEVFTQRFNKELLKNPQYPMRLVEIINSKDGMRDPNEEGLGLHGTALASLKSILKDGLGVGQKAKAVFLGINWKGEPFTENEAYLSFGNVTSPAEIILLFDVTEVPILSKWDSGRRIAVGIESINKAGLIGIVANIKDKQEVISIIGDRPVPVYFVEPEFPSLDSLSSEELYAVVMEAASIEKENYDLSLRVGNKQGEIRIENKRRDIINRLFRQMKPEQLSEFSRRQLSPGLRDMVEKAKTSGSPIREIPGKVPGAQPIEEIGEITLSSGDKLYMRKGDARGIISVAFYNKDGEQIGFIDILPGERLLNYIYIKPKYRGENYSSVFLDVILEKLQDPSFMGKEPLFVSVYVQNPLVVNYLLERGFMLNPYPTPQEQKLMTEAVIPKNIKNKGGIPLYIKDEAKRKALKDTPGREEFDLIGQPLEGDTRTVTINAKYTLYFSDKESIRKNSSTPISDKQEKKTGGIDFRALPISAQPTLAHPGVNLSLPPIIPLIQLEEEWSQIENLLAAGIRPSSQRIKEYLLSCCLKKDYNRDIDKVLSCIADMLRLEEERLVATDTALKEMLIVLESDKPADAMQSALTQITVKVKEPKH